MKKREMSHILTPTMATSIFKDGKVKPGIYKIQNQHSGTYLDVHQDSKIVCCRPAQDLKDGWGLVRLYTPSTVRVSDG